MKKQYLSNFSLFLFLNSGIQKRSYVESHRSGLEQIKAVA